MDKELYGKNIATRFKNYSADMKDVWETYKFIQQYMGHLHPLIKNDSCPLFSLDPLGSDDGNVRTVEKDKTFGYLAHVTEKVNPERCLLTAVSLTEDFLQDMVRNVYTAYPEKLGGTEPKDAPERVGKVIDVILESLDRDEIIDRLVEEKIRGIFYGNPVDFFLKDQKMKLKFGRIFSENHSENIDIYTEIIARRNIYAHNGGRVDRKYIRETESEQSLIGKKLKISESYMKNSILVLRGLSAVSAHTVLRRVFSLNAKGRLLQVYNQFDKKYSDNARSA